MCEKGLSVPQREEQKFCHQGSGFLSKYQGPYLTFGVDVASTDASKLRSDRQVTELSPLRFSVKPEACISHRSFGKLQE